MLEQESSPCYHTFLTVSPSYHSKMNLDSPLDSEKLAEAVLLYEFNMAFPAALFSKVMELAQGRSVANGATPFKI